MFSEYFLIIVNILMFGFGIDPALDFFYSRINFYMYGRQGSIFLLCNSQRTTECPVFIYIFNLKTIDPKNQDGIEIPNKRYLIFQYNYRS